MSRSEYRHASAVIWRGTGILFVGEPMSGKSTLAAEMISRGAELVGDDQLLLCEENGKVFADVPPALAGVLELRDLALLRVPYVVSTQIHLVVECGKVVAGHKRYEIFHIALPAIALDPTHADSAAKLMLYAEALQEGRVLPVDWKP